MNNFEAFVQLHNNPSPVVLGNIWDVHSATVFEAAGYQAIGVSSQAVSNSLGYADGENLPFDLLLRLAKRVVEVVKIPFSVDMEGGYDKTAAGIINNINKLHDAGVVGINLEDTIPGASRQFQSAEIFRGTLSAIADHISQNNMQLFLNIRTDGFLMGSPTALEDTLVRVKTYEDAGAQGIFVPCITDGGDIKTVVKATALPVNVMCMPALPGFDELGALGVKRISMGPFLFNKLYNNAGALAKAVLSDNSFASIL
ncbi:MAG: isocitrate lyase/phosphoenolpyruvate mutase family protein [Bacteroidota bacterium]|nr:isocitrate lyase/phosphoenolpyruvate mutase family protein [Bacteroidota bacterium]